MNRICELFKIKYPIIQGGMIWCSGWRLASAVSDAGGLGLIGGGSMYPDIFRENIRKCKAATEKPFGVNIPLLYPQVDDLMNIVVEEQVKIVFTSAGNPKTWTPFLKDKGIIVAHVVPGTKYAVKCETAGVDAVVAEGFEAGGHNGREETTPLCLIPQVAAAISLPVIAAGGIASGKAVLGAMVLGADGVQIGSRFAVSRESSAHESFKRAVVEAKEGDTRLMLKKLAPVRLLANGFSKKVYEAEELGADVNALTQLLGKGRAKNGMFEGDLEEGELEIGQTSSMINRVQPVAEIIQDIWEDYQNAKKRVEDFI